MFALSRLDSCNSLFGLFVGVDGRQHRRQIRIQHVDGRADHPVDHELAHSVIDQDLRHLKPHFTIVEIHLELAQTQTVVGAGDGFRRSGTTAPGYQQRRPTHDLKQIRLRLDTRRDPIHGHLSPQIEANRLAIVGPVADPPFAQQID